jgi:hypothetical protein
MYCLLGDLENLLYTTNILSAIDIYIRRHYPGVIIKKGLSKKQELVKEQLQELYIQARASRDIDEFHLEVLGTCLNNTVVLEALITLIVVRNLPYNLVE